MLIEVKKNFWRFSSCAKKKINFRSKVISKYLIQQAEWMVGLKIQTGRACYTAVTFTIAPKLKKGVELRTWTNFTYDHNKQLYKICPLEMELQLKILFAVAFSFEKW